MTDDDKAQPGPGPGAARRANANGTSQHVVLVTGASGAGRTTAIRALEDFGYEIIENLPMGLIPRLLQGEPHDRPLALGVDVRTQGFSAETMVETVDMLVADPEVDVELLFLDCRAEVLAQRYSETRRRHPLSRDEGPVRGIEREIGLLIYNAAYSPLGAFFEQPLATKLKVLDVNCRGPLILTHEYAGAMRARGRGGVILMGSLAGMQGAPTLATYAASKAFDLILAESLWAELRDTGVDVLACVAGATRTPGFEANASAASGPVMEPSAVAEEALAALGWQPSLIPGVANRLATFVMSRLPRRARVQIMRSALGG